MTTFTDAELDALTSRLLVSRAVWENAKHRPTDDESLAAAAITYLRAALAAKVRVKPLVWDQTGSFSAKAWVGETCYHVVSTEKGVRWNRVQNGVGPSYYDNPAYETADLAKAAAQADYDARILAALAVR